MATRLASRKTTAGARLVSDFWRISVHTRWKYCRSETMSSFGRPSAAVRMITPPPNWCWLRNSLTMPRSRLRSSRVEILRDTPTWSTVGMNTRKRPGMVTCEVSRAPLVPSGSLATWTMMSCPSLTSSSIFGSGSFSRCAAIAAAAGRGRAAPPPLAAGAASAGHFRRAAADRAGAAAGSSSSSSPLSRSNSSIVLTTSET